jgi:hypothetical protein
MSTAAFLFGVAVGATLMFLFLLGLAVTHKREDQDRATRKPIDEPYEG